MAPAIISGPCREWGKWNSIITHPNFPVDDYIYWTAEDPGGIDEANSEWWYQPCAPLPDPGKKFYLEDIYFTLYGRHGYVIFPTTLHNLAHGTYQLHCDIVNFAGEHHTQHWDLIVP